LERNCSIANPIFLFSNKWLSRCSPNSKNTQTPGPECQTYWRNLHSLKQRCATPHSTYSDRLIRDQYIGLQILEKLITTKWKTLPDGQRQGQGSFRSIFVPLKLNLYKGIRNFIVGITVKVASDEVALRKEKAYINKLNLALVQVWLSSIRIIRVADHKC
jgi:hypothetical protein